MSEIPGPPSRLAALHHLLAERIAAGGGRLPFRDYMEAALYAPDLGYYAAGAVTLGRGGDFMTSPEVDPAFGRALAHWITQVDAALDRPTPFTVLEMGAGSGRLVVDILAALAATNADLLGRLTYQIIERSPALRARQEGLLAQGPPATIQWLDRLADLPDHTLVGAIISNELVDAFPVHRVQMTTEGLQESYVTLGADGTLTEVLGPPSTPALAAHLAWLGVAPPPGTWAEINLDAIAWMGEIARVLRRGVVLTIDYGDTADRLYSGQRPAGTLLCYTEGRVSDNLFAAPGAQDMTAHVDFTALQQAGAIAGLSTVTLTRQMPFLVEHGLGDRMAGLSAHYGAQTATLGVRAASEAMMAARARLFRLIDPDGLGRFHVLIQARGVRVEG